MYDHIKALFATQLPFVTHNFMAIDEIGPGTASARMPEREELKNHIGTQHAAALFGLGETASGAAMASAIGARLLEARVVAAGASIQYKKVAKGPIGAKAQVGRPVDEVTGEYDEAGKTVLDVLVSLRNAEDVEVASMTVSWHVSKRRSG